MSISHHAPIHLEGSYLANARRSSLRISERRVLLLLGDALILLFCSAAALSLWVAFRPNIILTGEFFLHHLVWLVALLNLFFFFLSANQLRSLYSSILGDLPVLRVQPAIFVVLAVLFELAWRASYKISGAVWAQENDPRITKFGNFLCKSRMDELPQFWNVLKGEMSLVGPRLERPEFVEQPAKQIPFYRNRHAVKPELTGWA